jgi:predicted amidohydrolase YtcJ
MTNIRLLTGFVATVFAVTANAGDQAKPRPADTLLLGGKILTVDARDSVAAALAIRDGRIIAVGSNADIQKLAGDATRSIRLDGKTVIPGIIATHCHAVGVARGSLVRRHVELLSIADIQKWIRKQVKELPAGRWIEVPRADITRLKERRHPTPAELDAACSTHPVIFTAARKSVLNSLALKTAGIDDAKKTIPGLRVIRDEEGKPLLISGGGSYLRKFQPRAEVGEAETLAALKMVHQRYNQLGITSIFERALTPDQFAFYKTLHAADELTVRTTATFRSSFRSGEAVEAYTKQLGMKTGDGDDWLRVGPLKITVDGGIHWGNTYLREAYGKKRIDFYVHDDPEYRGSLNYSVEQMTDVFRAGHALGWQMCCHVTGDAGVDAVLDALEAVDKETSLKARRFTLVHAYFPARDSIARAAKLGVCVDTQAPLYYKDSDAMAEFYGADWAARFIGIGDWLRGGVPTAINGDHMMGLDPDTSMNAYNPFLWLQVAVTRKNRSGRVYGPRQKISRLQALRCITANGAYLAFDEKRKGSLAPGQLADLAVLDRDYLLCPEEEIRRIKPVLTMLDGKVIYRAKIKQ